MREYARVCESMREYARVCESMREYARVCESMREAAKRFDTGLSYDVKNIISVFMINYKRYLLSLTYRIVDFY